MVTIVARIWFDGRWRVRFAAPTVLTSLEIGEPTREAALFAVQAAIAANIDETPVSIEWEDAADTPLSRTWLAVGSDAFWGAAAPGPIFGYGGTVCAACSSAVGPRSETPLRIPPPSGPLADFGFLEAEGRHLSCVSTPARQWLEGLAGPEWCDQHLRELALDQPVSRRWSSRFPFYEVGGTIDVRVVTSVREGSDRICRVCRRARAAPTVIAGRVWIALESAGLERHTQNGSRVMLAADDYMNRIVVRRDDWQVARVEKRLKGMKSTSVLCG